MPGSVLRKTLGDLRRGFAWWALGLVAYVAMIAAVYPTIRDNDEHGAARSTSTRRR